MKEGRMQRLLFRVTPRNLGIRLLVSAALALAAIAVLTVEQSFQWIYFAWTLGISATLLLLSAHWSIKARFDRVCEAVENIGLGDISGTAGSTLTTEDGRVYDSVHLMNKGLLDIVSQVRTSAEKMRAAGRDISGGSADLSGRTEEQAATLEEIASSMEQLSSTVRQNAENCQSASTLARDSATLAGKGAECVHRAVDSMRLVEDGSRKIADISKLIESIALQTNILALNAAVEAARAGEQGRGFAVVAGEVRELAQRCSNAAQDIKKLIDNAVANTDASVQVVRETGEVIEKVATSIKRASQLIGEIALASKDQSGGVEQVGQSIVQLEHVNLQNAALVEETSRVTRTFEEEVEKLKEVVNDFKIDRAEGRRTAIGLVRRAAAHMRQVGKRKALDDFDNPNGEFVFGEYYLWVMDVNGVRMANGSDPGSRGQDILDLRDVDGRPHVRTIIEKAQTRGKGWQDYKWMNPLSKRIEMKSVYFELIDGAIIACGIYKPEDDAANEAHAEQPLEIIGRLMPKRRNATL